jgi:phage gpG-like protein
VNVSFNIPAGELEGMEKFLYDALAEVRPQVHQAMGQRFHDVVLNNFGFTGVDRPNAWAPLSPAYAKKVGREVATLFVTGALKDSIMVGGAYGESVTVSVSDASVPYATVHQTGGVRMPKRPYFPINDNGEVLPWTQSQVVEAAQTAIERAFE